MLKDVVEMTVGATALCFGDLSQGLPTIAASTGVVAAVLGRDKQLSGECARVLKRVEKEYAKALTHFPEDHAILMRQAMEAVDGIAASCLFEPRQLAQSALTPEGFPGAATRQLRAEIARRASHLDDDQLDFAARMIGTCLEAAVEEDAFYRQFRKQLSIAQAQQIGLIRAEQAEIARRVDEIFNTVVGAPREFLENIAQRFGHDNPDAPLPDLQRFLKDKAAEYRELKTRFAALAEADGRIANLMAAAEDAIARGDFAEADVRLSDAEEMQVQEHALAPIRKLADLREQRGRAALLAGDADKALVHFQEACDPFDALDVMEGWERRAVFAQALYDSGARYGGTGLAGTILLLRKNLTVVTRGGSANFWAGTLNNLGIALEAQGTRTGGSAGTDLLGQAVAAYRAALEVRTREAHPVDWAMTQNNLGNALYQQGTRTAGSAGADLLGRAVAAHRAALEVRTREAHPVDWAGTQNNLGNALYQQGTRTAGSAGADLLGKAVAAYRAALEIFTREAHPVQWAITQNNLGGALYQQGIRTDGSAGADLFGQSVAAYRASLEVRTREAHPVQWAMTQKNLGLLYECWSEIETEHSTSHLRSALSAVDLSLEIYDPVHMSHYHQQATALREDILAALEDASE
ncbi:tetratricopeptide repeat protein [Roseobacter sp. HKCCA0434]|uniref:tetratricopeptide repeat protein n=1 Tax=Roseobacter sp. HKCCA0434 TaxID=3079297 RepID=UPI002905D293|nr:tetratricopeptide repeat protein [Roseobacter sp. HKCCA0434]